MLPNEFRSPEDKSRSDEINLARVRRRANVANPDLPPEGRVPTVWFAVFGAGCGFLIIIAAIFAVWFDPTMSRFRWPMIVVGLACICASLGGVAVVRYKGIAAGGVAAVVLALGLIFKPDPPPVPPAHVPYVYGYVRGTGEMTNVLVGNFLTGRLTEGGDFEFFAREEQIVGRIFSIQAKNAPGKLPAKIIVGCLPIELLRNSIGNRDGVDLSLSPASDDPSAQVWVLRETGRSDALGEFGNPECRRGGLLDRTAQFLDNSMRSLWSIVAPIALAGEGPQELSTIVESLGSSYLSTQAEAQNKIAAMRDPQALKSLLSVWNPPSGSASVDTNMVVALVQGIRANRIVAAYVANAINTQQIAEIIQLAGNSDKLVRFNATELLSWVLQATRWPSSPADSQVAMLEQAVAAPLIDPMMLDDRLRGNSIYNLLIAIQDSACAHEDKLLGAVVLNAVATFANATDTDRANLIKSRSLAADIQAAVACQ